MSSLKDKETDTIYYTIEYEDGCHTHKINEEFKGFYSKDVKEAVLEFETWLDNYKTDTETYELTEEEVRYKFKEIFGDWER